MNKKEADKLKRLWNYDQHAATEKRLGKEAEARRKNESNNKY